MVLYQPVMLWVGVKKQFTRVQLTGISEDGTQLQLRKIVSRIPWLISTQLGDIMESSMRCAGKRYRARFTDRLVWPQQQPNIPLVPVKKGCLLQ